ncbi:endonuclease domain-containing protein [Nocardia sp. NPDC050435]|uniref:endonuclease domain-containing protein n=1 Tax=Nocardia sp. NPDC050435 TaxID=3155040 RepID=UPI0033F26630
MIRCTRCRELKAASEFHRNATKAGGLERQCRSCAADRKLLRRYGISRSDYNSLVSAQGGRCRICIQPPAKGPLVVDHSHREPMRVRALLCGNCNTALGLFGDNSVVMARAAEYIGAQDAF